MDQQTEKLSTTQLLNSFDSTASEFLSLLSSFDESEFNVIPFEGSWTAGQLGEHILKSATGITQMLSGNALPADRPADKNVETLKLIFLDFTTKGKAAIPVTPSDDPKDKEKLINALSEKMADMRHIAKTSDLSLLCTAVPFPTIGLLTRWEWISFVIYHTQRHTHQLQNIHKKIKAKHEKTDRV